MTQMGGGVALRRRGCGPGIPTIYERLDCAQADCHSARNGLAAQVNAAFVGSLAETLSSALNVELFREAEFYYFLQTTGNIPLCKHSRLYNAGSSRWHAWANATKPEKMGLKVPRPS
jgi:hypothetical protein